MKNFAIVFALLIPFTFAFSNNVITNLTDCSAPDNITVVSQTSTSVTYSWDDCNCSVESYHIYYVKNGLSSAEQTTSGTSITFTGLSTGTYKFYFYTACTDGGESIIIEDIIVL